MHNVNPKVHCPTFVEAMQSLLNHPVAVQTGKHVQQGILTAVFPDLLVLEVCQIPFYFRVEEIVWVSPVLMKTKK